MSAYLTREAFTEQLNTTFRVRFDQPPHELKLTLFEIVDGFKSEETEQFALHFRGPLEIYFRQAMLRLEHDVLEPMELLLVAISKEPDAMIYEAAFNRLINKEEEAAG